MTWDGWETTHLMCELIINIKWSGPWNKSIFSYHDIYDRWELEYGDKCLEEAMKEI